MCRGQAISWNWNRWTSGIGSWCYRFRCWPYSSEGALKGWPLEGTGQTVSVETTAGLFLLRMKKWQNRTAFRLLSRQEPRQLLGAALRCQLIAVDNVAHRRLPMFLDILGGLPCPQQWTRHQLFQLHAALLQRFGQSLTLRMSQIRQRAFGIVG